jgi:hypothetical protein
MITKKVLNSIINDPTLSDLDDDIYNECIVKLGNQRLKSFIEWEKELRGFSRTEGLDYMFFEFCQTTYNYIKQGNILWYFWHENLWREDKKYRNFKDFCKNALKLHFWQVKNTINASAIATNLIKLGFTELPASISIAAVLKLLKNEGDNLDSFEERLIKVWKKVLELHPTKRTAKKVKEIIKLIYPDVIPIPTKRKVILDTELVDRLEVEAVKKEVTVNGVINNMYTHIEHLEEKIEDLEYELKHSEKPFKENLTLNDILLENQLFDQFRKQCEKLSINYLSILKQLTISKIIRQINELITMDVVPENTS